MDFELWILKSNFELWNPIINFKFKPEKPVFTRLKSKCEWEHLLQSSYELWTKILNGSDKCYIFKTFLLMKYQHILNWIDLLHTCIDVCIFISYKHNCWCQVFTVAGAACTREAGIIYGYISTTVFIPTFLTF